MQEKAHALYKQELAWMRKGAEARRTKQKARIERFYELEDSLTTQQEEKMDISLQHSRLGKKIIEIDHLRKTFGDKVCIDDLTYAVVRHDRIGIVGNNGLGKSTLLNIIGRGMPYDSGSVVLGDTVRIGYYTQDNSDLPDDMRVLDYVREKGEYIRSGDGTLISASKMLERFLFSGRAAAFPNRQLIRRRKTAALSAGRFDGRCKRAVAGRTNQRFGYPDAANLRGLHRPLCRPGYHRQP